MGQRNCSIKDDDELVQIIGQYRMTSELHWLDLKGIDSQMKQCVMKKDSYSSDSLDEFSEENSANRESYSNTSYKLDMNNEKSLSTSSSENSSVHDNISITSHYSFEIEETQELETENITESIDIRISPRNSVMSFDCSNNFYSEFSLVANVEVQLPEMNDNLDNASEQSFHANNELINEEYECETNDNIPDGERLNLNENDNINIEKNHVHCDAENQSSDNKKVPDKYYANKMEITKCEKRASSSVEKKIAEEIKELKRREEDLRAMREKFAKEMTEKTANDFKNSKTLVIKPETKMSTAANCDEKPMPKTTAEKRVKSAVENTYVPACVFAVKRRDNATRKDHSEIISKKSSAIAHQETPVEKEIRIAKEREEELKRDREQALKAKMEMDSFNSELSTPDGDSALSVCSDSSLDSVSKLASFFPRTLSPEISKSNGISMYSSISGSLCSLESFSQRERLSAGSLIIGGSSNGSVLSPSPDSGYFKSGYSFTSPQAFTEKRNQNIDMERFISSKGKEIKFKGEVGNPGHPNYYEIKPPQVKKGEEMTCKRFVTAATKIKQELKEMQEREEQFKKERATLQQDIQNQCNTEKNELASQENNANENKPETTEKIAYTDLPGDNLKKDNNKEQDNSAKQARRSSILIDEWEQRIQKSFLQP